MNVKTAIVTASRHHGNTKKLVDAIAKDHEVTIIDSITQPQADLTEYDLIGFASGVAFGKLYKPMNAFIKNNLPEGKKVFFLYTCGRNDKDFAAGMKALALRKGCSVLGAYGCSGFDTFGPLRFFGGLNAGHPDEREIQGAVDFFDHL